VNVTGKDLIKHTLTGQFLSTKNMFLIARENHFFLRGRNVGICIDIAFGII
jgi:hypothetical protein